MVNTKKSVKSRIKTLIKAGAVAAALAAGGTSNAAVGSPMRRGVRSVEPVECVPTTVEYVEPVVECVPRSEPVRCAPAPQRCRPVRVERPVRQQPTRSVNYQHSESSYESYTSTSTYYESTSGGFDRPMFGRGSRSVGPTIASRMGTRAQTISNGVQPRGRSMRGASVMGAYAGPNGRFSSMGGRQMGRVPDMGGRAIRGTRSMPDMGRRRNAMPRGGGRMRGPGGRGRGF